MKKLTKKDLNQNICISNANDKLSDNENYSFYIFNLPSLITCPYSTNICRKTCYAKSAENMFPLVRSSRSRNLEESKKDSFVNDMVDYIAYLINSKKNKNKQIIFRLHESGDFYNQEYVNKWIEIAGNFREYNIIFQAYTKSIKFFKDKNLNDINIKILFSEMPDTKAKDLELAKQMNMSIFKLLPVGEKEDKDMIICPTECTKCMMCYKGNDKLIYVKQHGAGIKSDKSHRLDRFTEYKKRTKQKKI